MITGMSRRVGSALMRSSTAIPSISGITMSSSTTSSRASPSSASACTPFSAVRTV